MENRSETETQRCCDVSKMDKALLAVPFCREQIIRMCDLAQFLTPDALPDTTRSRYPGLGPDLGGNRL